MTLYRMLAVVAHILFNNPRSMVLQLYGVWEEFRFSYGHAISPVSYRLILERNGIKLSYHVWKNGDYPNNTPQSFLLEDSASLYRP